MGNQESTITDTWQEALTHCMKANRADLLSSYQQVLRETLFNRRTAIRPNMLKGIASNEIDALEAFFSQAATCSVTDRGEKLQQMGLSELAILRMGQVTRQFCVAHLETQHIASALKVIDAYQEAVVQGYMQAQEQTVVKEQELIRSALKKAIGRYMVEIEEIEAIARQATEASEFKTRFIARIGHELRTPLGAMMGMTEMLQEGVYGTLTPEQREITQRIIHKAVVLKEIFTELLDQSQIESGKLRLKAEEFSPKTLIETVHANYLPMALQKGLSVYVKIGSDLPPVLIGDRSRIEQIVTNLAVNAIKFTETGSITLHASLADAAYWEIVVKDTGIGIDAEQLAYVFEPFRQIDETSSRKYGGVGLGLAIVQQLVEAMNGTVAVKSKLGQGTVFTVRLPLQLPD